MIRRILVAAFAVFLISCVPMPDGVMVIGDSITAQGDTVEAMRAELGPRDVVNAGCGATTTYTWLQFQNFPHEGLACGEALNNGGAFEPLVEPFITETHVVFVHLGVNDARFRAACLFGYQPCDNQPIEVDEYVANLTELIAWIDESRGGWSTVTGYPVVVLVKPALIDCDAIQCNLSAWFANARLLEYGDAIQAMCDTNGQVLCGPDLKAVMLPEHYNAGDGVHPNQEGYQAIADAYLDYLAAMNL